MMWFDAVAASIDQKFSVDIRSQTIHERIRVVRVSKQYDVRALWGQHLPVRPDRGIVAYVRASLWGWRSTDTRIQHIFVSSGWITHYSYVCEPTLQQLSLRAMN
jgi:hypothetical protein